MHVNGIVGQQTQEQPTQEAIRRRRNIISCDLLLGRLLRFHPDQIGIIYEVKELDPPPPPKIEVLPVDGDATMEAIAGQPPTLNEIIQTVARFYRLSVVQMMANRRMPALVRPRQIAMYLCRRLTYRSLPEIGRYMAGRDHTTIMHGARKIEREIKEHDRTRDEIDVLILHIRETQLNNASRSVASSVSTNGGCHDANGIERPHDSGAGLAGGRSVQERAPQDDGAAIQDRPAQA